MIHPLNVALIATRLKLDVPSIVTALLHDVVEDTPASLGEVQSPVRRRNRPTGRRRYQGLEDRVPEPRGEAGGELPQDDHRDGARHPGRAGQARRPAAQHAHAGPSEARSATRRSRARRSKSTRRSPIASASTGSSRSSRTTHSATSTRRTIRRIAAFVAKTSEEREGYIAAVTEILGGGWRAPACTPKSPAATSISIRSTPRCRTKG